MTVAVLFVVDAEAALASDGLGANLYCVDTEGYLGSWGEGDAALHTLCQDGQILSWHATGIGPGNDVELTGFSGDMVESGTCRPARTDVGGQVWSGRVDGRGGFRSWAFTASISIDGAPMSFGGTIKIV